MLGQAYLPPEGLLLEELGGECHFVQLLFFGIKWYKRAAGKLKFDLHIRHYYCGSVRQACVYHTVKAVPCFKLLKLTLLLYPLLYLYGVKVGFLPCTDCLCSIFFYISIFYVVD